MKYVFVDTGAWYALADRKDPDHAPIKQCLDQYRGRLLTSNFVLDESVTLLRYRLGWRVAEQVGGVLMNGSAARLVRISEADEEHAWDIFSRYSDQSFSFTDCTSFALVKRLKIETNIAIDRDFRAYGLICLP